MIKSGFVRVLWGEYSKNVDAEFERKFRSHIFNNYSRFSNPSSYESYIVDNLRYIKECFAVHNKDRIQKVKENVEKSLAEEIKFPFVCYTFGTNNHEWLKSVGVNSVLINEFPNPYYMYRHKMDAWIHGMNDFDEIVFLDWDTKPLKPIDDNFWELLNKKAPIQASLSKYKHPRIQHRSESLNKWMPSAQFVYFRDKKLVEKSISFWEEECQRWAEEPGLARLTDALMGGFDMRKYELEYEPDVFKNCRCPFSHDPSNLYFHNRGHPWRY